MNSSKKQTDRCVCCGDLTPEGRQICWKCEHASEKPTSESKIIIKKEPQKKEPELR